MRKNNLFVGILITIWIHTTVGYIWNWTFFDVGVGAVKCWKEKKRKKTEWISCNNFNEKSQERRSLNIFFFFTNSAIESFISLSMQRDSNSIFNIRFYKIIRPFVLFKASHSIDCIYKVDLPNFIRQEMSGRRLAFI